MTHSPQDGKQQKQKLAHLAMTIVTKGENAQRGIEMDKKQTEALLDILSNIAESLHAIAVNAGSIEYHQRHLTDISNSGFGFVKDVADAVSNSAYELSNVDTTLGDLIECINRKTQSDKV